MYGIDLKVLVAMVTEVCIHFISAMACNFLKQMIFLKSFHSVLFVINMNEFVTLVKNTNGVVTCDVKRDK